MKYHPFTLLLTCLSDWYMTRRIPRIKLKITGFNLLYCSVWPQLLGAECCSSGTWSQSSVCIMCQRWQGLPTLVSLKEGFGPFHCSCASNSLLCGKRDEKMRHRRFCSWVWISCNLCLSVLTLWEKASDPPHWYLCDGLKWGKPQCSIIYESLTFKKEFSLNLLLPTFPLPFHMRNGRLRSCCLDW